MTKKIPVKSIKIKNRYNVANDEDKTKEFRKRLTIDIPASLHMKLKIESAKTGETMGEIVCQVLNENLKSE